MTENPVAMACLRAYVRSAVDSSAIERIRLPAADSPDLIEDDVYLRSSEKPEGSTEREIYYARTLLRAASVSLRFSSSLLIFDYRPLMRPTFLG